MTYDNFVVWRFKTIDGVLDKILVSRVTETVFKDESIFKYDYKNEIVEYINEKNVFDKVKTFKFKELTKDKLKSLGFVERTTNRNALSYIETKFDFLD